VGGGARVADPWMVRARVLMLLDGQLMCGRELRLGKVGECLGSIFFQVAFPGKL
jgi:hypothetical protein